MTGLFLLFRTESGGLSFDAIHRIMGLCPAACDGSVLVVPDSSKGAFFVHVARSVLSPVPASAGWRCCWVALLLGGAAAALLSRVRSAMSTGSW